MARSLGVLMCAPFVALPTGADEPRPADVARAGSLPVPSAAASVSAQAKSRVRPTQRARVAEPRAVKKRAEPAAPPHEISVDCRQDGCVVQDGLDVLVVANKPRAR